ncbi:sugar O-acetyltransferase [Methylocystaceae bacterium]|nr:sugar O-acetyltransferase [Methylocystaceae bacterium]
MLFYEPLFLFLFAPAVYLLYWLLGEGRAQRLFILLLASILFYGWSELVFILVVFASLALDLFVAQKIGSLPIESAHSKSWLVLGVTSNLLILVYYKYAGFLAANIDAALGLFSLSGFSIWKIALPIGVSFIVFEKITYLVDIYRGVSKPAKDYRLYMLYVFFFPKLLAGPIIKYHDIANQLEECRHAGLDDVILGFTRFMLGVIKKILIADTMAQGADIIFSRDPSFLEFGDAWIGVIFFTLQIYFDFSAYSDMAIGLARMLGFRLLENFNMPYIAINLTDFWRRWHMSLTSWIREYLYFPLGGNRGSPARTYLNLWVCFLASGVWHGAAWPFVLWGAYNGIFLILDRLFLIKWLNYLPEWVSNLLTMIIVMIGWSIFRSTNLDQSSHFLSAMTSPFVKTGVSAYIPIDYFFMMGFALLICFFQRLSLTLKDFDWETVSVRFPLVINCLVSVFFVAALAKGFADPFKPFIYFRF